MLTVFKLPKEYGTISLEISVWKNLQLAAKCAIVTKSPRQMRKEQETRTWEGEKDDK